MGVTAAPAGRPGDAAPLTFAKLHGLGNSYLFVYADRDPADPAALSVRLSDPRRGVGADGMIWILPSAVADFRMRVFNADGSEAAMCGNGIRCLGKYVYDRGLTARTELTVETPAGIRRLWLHTAGGRVASVTADMGRAAVCAARTLTLPDGETITLRRVSVGNPHAVLFRASMPNAALLRLGTALQTHPAFPGGVNVELVHLSAPATLRMRVFERGSGVTSACGTGACAAVAAAVADGVCASGADITVRLDGGELTVRAEPDGTLFLTGAAEEICEGTAWV